MVAHRRLATVTIIASVLLLVVALIHRQFMGDPVYVNPVFVGIVVWPFFLLLFLAMSNFAFAIVQIVKKDTKAFISHAVSCLCAVIACIAAVLIDASTLMYAT